MKGFPSGWSLDLRNDDDELVEFIDIGGMDYNDPAAVAELVGWLRDRQKRSVS